MASRLALPYTDEEIIRELEKLGFYNVSQHLLDVVKEDLASIVGEEMNAAVSEVVTSISNDSISQMNISPSSVQGLPSCVSKKQVCKPSVKSSSSKSKSCTSKKNVSSKENENTFMKNSNSTVERMVTRKVLRSVNGEPVITEEFRNACYFKGISGWRFDTTVDRNAELSSNGTSRDFLSTISENSSIDESESQSSKQSDVPKLNVRHKKCDPVTRYHEYRKHWEAFKIPGDGKHKFLRWTIKQKMLDYDFA